MAIASDKPFLIGDYIKIGDYEGTVTDIKFRCTRIRTPDDTVVTVQNSTITKSEIVNYSRMTKRRMETSVNIPLETNSNKIEEVSNMLKSVLESAEHVIPDSVRVYFDKIDDDSIKIGIYLYTGIVNYDEFLEFKTKINLSIIKTLEMEKIHAIYPTQTIYSKTDVIKEQK